MPNWKSFWEAWYSIAKKTHQISVEHGFDSPDQNQAEVLALIHSEISEALEAIRKGNPTSEKIPPYSCVEEELADAVIRIMNFGKTRNWDIAGAIQAKTIYNNSRPYRHGGKSF
jgi:NTP pyrophosphatase (non-canonical NTP hydrolase)